MDWATLGAFLSGAASVLSAWWYTKKMRERAEADCAKRLEAFKEGLHEMDPRGGDRPGGG